MKAMENFVVGAIVALILGLALFYVIRAKRRGQKCIGCPYANACGGKCSENASSKEQSKSSDQKEDGRK